MLSWVGTHFSATTYAHLLFTSDCTRLLDLKCCCETGGHSHRKVERERAALKTPFFRPNLSSGDPPFASLFPALETPLRFFEKNHALQDQFLPIFSSWDTNYGKNLFQRPQFQAKKSVPETLFLKAQAAHIYQLDGVLFTFRTKLAQQLLLSSNNNYTITAESLSLVVAWLLEFYFFILFYSISRYNKIKTWHKTWGLRTGPTERPESTEAHKSDTITKRCNAPISYLCTGI